MKLSKQERIGVLIIAVIIILGLGIFFFLVPKWEDISASQVALDAKVKERDTLVAKADLKTELRTQIEEAYEAGRTQADMFFEEMTTYQADQETRAFLQQVKDKGIDVVVEDMTISEPGVSTLSVSFFEEKEVTYPLKTYATQGVQPTEDELKAAARRETLMTALAGVQDVGSIVVTFEVTAEELEHLLDFADAVNEYEKDENGTSTRKAVMMSGFSLEYKRILEEYDAMAADMEEEINEKALEELAKKWGDLADVPDDGPNAPVPEGGTTVTEDEEDKLTVEDTIYSLEVSLTYYSIERMESPKALLDQQDEAA